MFALAIAALSSLGTYWYMSSQVAQSNMQQTYQPAQTVKPSVAVTQPSISASQAISQDVTANWKIYTNIDGRYLLKYPSNFTLHVNESRVSETAKYAPAKNHIELNSPTAGAIPFITVDYQTNTDPLDQFITNKSSCTAITPTKGSEVLLSGITGKLYENTPCGVAGDTEVFIVNNGIGYIITFQGNVEKSFINEFLSSISFIK